MPGPQQLILLLIAAVVLVPLAARLGLGAVMGYLITGVLVGPWSLGVVSNVDKILHFAEYGVVLLLFIIGLELRPSRLWALRRSIFGLGSAQFIVSAIALSAIMYASAGSISEAVVVGLVLALSSTAFALQLLAERGELTTRWGRSAFGILLFQDLAVVPLLALLPLLGSGSNGASGGWQGAAVSVGALLVVVLGGRYILRFLLWLAARSKVREILTATALLVAFGTAFFLQLAGLSMELGAFLAGVLLADSEFRHQLEADIEPFKGLLLGLFFIAVGMSMNLGLLVESPGVIAITVVGIVATKLAVLVVLGRLSGLSSADSGKLGIAISQGGEFAFVLFGVAVTAGALDASLSELLIVAVSLSMVTTPLLFLLNDRFLRRAEKAPDYDEIEAQEPPVLIVGFGRFGQVVARVLSAKRIPFVALDASHQQVDFVRQYGNDIYYGDGSRIDLLEAAGAGSARLLVLAIDDADESLKAAAVIREHFPELAIYARARDRKHAYRLMDLGVRFIRRETLHSSLALTNDILLGLGLDPKAARLAVDRFREHDERRLLEHRSLHDDEQKMQALARESARELEELFARDALELAEESRTTER
ncbi:glutathione-regulated potassium-efflux system protein KefB [Mangrovimicrobium sediminis]|uniref:Glutathione-regulated potassium-efflux system protein KefB n=1 Tax=Mangrovimicrobium sediminis TaxID=2562682 RepID=A0A4Z0M178_9GAMM|nr:monovalent cation:proton antiporter-2 (CPA2) family protein [Haliea sp. SAOS-164]TGD73362.1 glutathione-regulated potassium-efflux system protein KefB [Haliea sp. SAOS-164]